MNRVWVCLSVPNSRAAPTYTFSVTPSRLCAAASERGAERGWCVCAFARTAALRGVAGYLSNHNIHFFAAAARVACMLHAVQ